MARLPRLVVPGQAHHLVQRGHNAQPVFIDDEDRRQYLAALRDALRAHAVVLHAYALLDDAVQLLLRPPSEAALSRMVQAVGRRYVAGFNRRHGHRGSLWDGRFRCGVVEPGPMRLAALLLIDGQSAEPGITSASHRAGGARQALLTELPEVWELGNTPFEREAAYRGLLERGVANPQASTLRQAALGGWVAGSPAFAAEVAAATSRVAQPRPRGRPRRSAP